MRVLEACEFSGRVRDAFRALGHDDVSCDLLPTEKEGPHIQDDVLKHLTEGWDLMIAHPPCTYLCVSGARWMYDENPKYVNRRTQQKEALEFVKKLWFAPIPRICIENPIGALSSLWRKPTQIIQPYYFGEAESKATCLWLKNLPPLVRTKQVRGVKQSVWKEPPGPMQSINRSRTFQSIADAMAAQWGNCKPLKVLTLATVGGKPIRKEAEL